MPWPDLDKWATSHGVGITVLLVVIGAQFAAIWFLWLRSERLHDRLEEILSQRVRFLERLLTGREDRDPPVADAPPAA